VKTKPYRVLPVDDEQTLALVRYDGDPDVFTALAWAYLIENDLDYSIEPPEPRLFRCNPDFTGEYSWLMAEATERGRGVFLGARVDRGEYFEPEWVRKGAA
jgi:hypothetical protein